MLVVPLAIIFMLPARHLRPTDDLNFLALRHEWLFVVKMYRDSVLDAERVATRSDVLERGGCFVFGNLESEIPGVLSSWHLSTPEFE